MGYTSQLGFYIFPGPRFLQQAWVRVIIRVVTPFMRAKRMNSYMDKEI